jgi:hypothetical protein
MLMRYILSVAAAAAIAFTVTPAQPASAATTTTTTTTTTIRKAYLGTNEAFPNPGRGFYRYTETRLTGDTSGYRPLDVAALTRDRLNNAVTLVFRYFYLNGYQNRDTINPAELDLIRADLAATKAAGVKLIVRFAYSADSSADAPEWRVRGHIAQLAPVLNAHADVIAAVQAGFVGRWGEWYYSDNFTSDPNAPWRLTDTDWARRRSVLLALVDALSPTIQVQVRYPAIKQRIFPDAGDSRASRVGVHNDCFLASEDDFGTFQSAADRVWLAEQTRSVLMGGESCAVSGTRSQWSSASADLAAYHWSYLNADFHSEVLASWGEAGRAEVTRRLGYRLRLVQSTVPSVIKPGQTVQVRLTVTNDGYAAPTVARPVQLVIREGTRTRAIRIATDIRTWAPGTTVNLVASVTVPQTAGSYPLYLNLPDPSGSLAGQQPLAGGSGSVNTAYSIRLANPGIWDARLGWNNLNQSLTVTP